EWSTYSVERAGAYARDFAVPLLPSTGFPVGCTWTSVSPPFSPQRKLETELSPPLVVKRKRLSGERITLAAPSKEFGALSWRRIGLTGRGPRPPVAMRSTSSRTPFADRR